MDTFFRPTTVEISLDALEHNVQAMRAALPTATKMLASVKANAYGHGVVQVAKQLELLAVDYMGVAFLDEALQLRRAGIKTPILVLGYVPVDGLLEARDHSITISLFREDVRQAAAQLPDHPDGLKLQVHIKVDTGMGRLGVIGYEETLSFIEQCMKTPQLIVEGVFTHYANADTADKTHTQGQYALFKQIADAISARSWEIPYVHADNSAAGMECTSAAGNMVRFGIGMYGLYPSVEVNRQHIVLKPVLSLKSEIVFVKRAPENWGISYGSKYVTTDAEWIGTLPIGYADGYSRMLSGQAEVLVRGIRTKVLGNICMDQCMIALDPILAATNNEPMKHGEEVVLIGEQGRERITADELADKLGTIHYEVVCMLAARVPRIYRHNGKITAIVNPVS
ncbi:alanine racemase [Paenibacillus yanchengensis]|uniref:Alanine racemase n=1 Tax=Paenibacillus yanchengensis TaxID=2035833 RepID=A0ABW4YIZ6_9BACL